MNQYLLSLHSTPDSTCATQSPMPPEEMQKFMQRIETLESDMKESGAWMFSGRLTEPESATVVRITDGDTMTTDGPFAESKEHLAGFYILQAADLDAALEWARKVTTCVGKPIEVRPFWGLQS